MSESPEQTNNHRAVFTGVSLCFFLSGLAALLYQTAWMRQLSTVFGTSELAVATVLAAYMGGLAFGAAVAARYVDRIRRPILTYGMLEAAIAVSALAVPFLLQFAGVAYGAVFGGQAEPPDASGTGQSLFYLAVTFIVLAVPTACMGATLPMVTRYAVRSDEDVGPKVGLLYALNTVGAIFGTLAAAFLLLPALGLMGTILVGAGINILVFAIAALLARTPSARSAAAARTETPVPAGWSPQSWILPVMLVSGIATFTYEVLWTRLLSQVLGGSVIAFSTMLASFLAGIAIGSAVASRIAKSRPVSQIAFVIAELGIAGTSILIYLSLDRLVPENAGLFGNVTLAITLLLPATLFVGATFPLAVRILSQSEIDAPAAAARVYAWNTAGAIVGAIVAGFLLIPMLRYEGTIKLAVLINLSLALVAALAIPPRRVALAIVAGVSLTLAAFVFRPQPPEALLRVSPVNDFRAGEILFYDVGRSATVLVMEHDGFLNLRTNGLPEASIDVRGAPPARNSQRLLAVLPVLARPQTESMLIVGLGGGVVAEDIPTSVNDIDIVELEPKVLQANRSIAAARKIDPLQDTRINLVFNDGRNALRLSEKSYDAIISQPSHPWTAGASHLYTREYMELARSRLNDNGVFLQWMNTQFISEELLRSLAATLLDVFPVVRAYQFDPNVLYFLASAAPLNLELRFATSQEQQLSLEQYHRRGIGSIHDVVAALAWDTNGLRQLASDAPLITDNNNLMAMQSSIAYGLDGIEFARLQELIRQYGPLFDADSYIYNILADAIDFVYVGDRLARNYAPELAAVVADILEQTENDQALLLNAKILKGKGVPQRADRFLMEALRRDPTDPRASYLLYSDRREAVADGNLPERIQQFTDNLSPDAAAVLGSWVASRAGDEDSARQADAVLATAQPNDQWYLDAAKLRANWRIQALKDGETGPYGAEALQIIDDVIAVHQDIDFYGMRVAAAYLSDDYHAVVETSRRLVWLLRSDVDFRLSSAPESITGDYLVARATRIQSISTGLNLVRESGRIAAYKFVDLDNQIEKLMQLFQQIAEGGVAGGQQGQ